MPGAASVFIEWGSYEVSEASDYMSSRQSSSPGVIHHRRACAKVAAMVAGWLNNKADSPAPLATHTIFMATVSLWYMPPLGIAYGCATLVGNSLGSGACLRALPACLACVPCVPVVAALTGLAAAFTFCYVGCPCIDAVVFMTRLCRERSSVCSAGHHL